jgi:CheY-like chemotaxis protein
MERPLIAIINADRSFLELMSELFSDEGYRTLALMECQQALEIIVQRQPELLILELRLTDPECGRLMVQTIRSHPQTAHIPIIVATTAAQLIDDLEPRVPLQSCAILLMPFDVEELLAMVGTLVLAPAMHNAPDRTCCACDSSPSCPS